MPLIVRGPRVPQGKTVDNPAMNIDFAPTFADLAGAKTPSFVNGRSLVDAMHGKKTDSERKDVLVEHYAEGGGRRHDAKATTGQQDPDNDTNPPVSGTPTAGPQARAVRRGQFRALGIPDNAGIRTDRYTYIEYTTGERQLYDRHTDPDELHNIVSNADPRLVQDLARQLSALKSCRAAVAA